MAKKYIIKQTVNYAGRGEKTATFTVPCENDTQLQIITSELEGRIEVYEQNLSLSIEPATTSTMSFHTADSIKLRLRGAETKYISAYNRPIVFKDTTDINNLAELIKSSLRPFEAPFDNKPADDVSIDTGDIRKL